VPITETYHKIDSTDQVALIDTVYGIENENLIPTRHTEIIPKENTLIKESYSPSPIKTGTESWQIIILVIAVLLLGMVKAYSNNRYRSGLKALVNYGVAQETTREEQVFFHRSNMLLTLGYILTLSLFIYQVKWFALGNSIEPEGFSSFLIVVAGIILVYLVKYIFAKLLLFIFNDATIAPEYTFNVSLYNNLLGVVLIPLLCVNYFTAFPFQSLLIFIALPLALLVLVLRLIRLFVIGRARGVLYVYIFLYICTLEILPLVVLYRIFVR
jgi:hypothetical protein